MKIILLSAILPILSRAQLLAWHDTSPTLDDISLSMDLMMMADSRVGSKSSKAGMSKSGKSSKEGSLPYPSPPELERIEAIYAKQLTNKKFQTYTEAENTWFHKTGLNVLFNMVSTYSRMQLNPYYSDLVNLNEAKLVCATECAQQPTCQAVAIYLTTESDGLVNKEIYCQFIDPERGPIPISSPLPARMEKYEPSILYKEGVGPFPTFEACDVPYGDGQRLAINCVVCDLYGGQLPGCGDIAPLCNEDLLTDDFNTYQKPAVECVAFASGFPDTTGAAAFGVEQCLNCMVNLLESTALTCTEVDVGLCSEDEDTNFITGTCGGFCPDNCLGELQTGFLCNAARALLNNGQGCINSNQAGFNALGEDYTCP